MPDVPEACLPAQGSCKATSAKTATHSEGSLATPATPLPVAAGLASFTTPPTFQSHRRSLRRELRQMASSNSGGSVSKWQF